MSSGYAGDSSASAQSNAMDAVDNAIWAARQALQSYTGTSATHCQECGDEIPAGRRQAVPGVKYCVACQDSHMSTVKYKMLTKML